MKNPYIAALYPHIFDPEYKTAQDFLDKSGQNTGNYMFSSSVRRLVKTTTKTDRLTVNVPKVRRDCDGIVIAAANWLQPKNDFTGLANAIEKADVPTVITGLGAQAVDGKVPDLTEGTVRLLKVISERCDSISVCGPFSAEVLNHYGVQNVTVTGCPSLLWHLNHSAAVTRLPRPARIGRVSINGTVPGRAVPAKANPRMVLGRFIFQAAVAARWDYVAQTELQLMMVARGETDPLTGADWDFLRYAFDATDDMAIKRYLKRHLRCFTNVPEWLAYCANQDMVIGTRLHGVIAGLLAGTPSVLITHDSRTREMADFASIPAVDAEDVMASGGIDPAKLLAEADFAAFNRRQQQYFKDFTAFFDRNGVPHRLRMS